MLRRVNGGFGPIGRLAPAGLLLALAAAWLVADPTWLRLSQPGGAERMAAAVDDIPAAAQVLVGFDPDLGTYPEVRPAVRALLDDLAARGVGLGFVSVTAEGRALASIELARLAGGAGEPATATDLGFVAGAEAALVELAGGVVDDYDAIVVVGGNDIGPRSWVEQVLPRADPRPVMAIVPTVLLPEVRPYVASGQLTAAIVTPREGAAFGQLVGAGPAAGPSVTSLAVALVVAIAVLLQAVLGRGAGLLRAARAREAA